MRDFLTTRVGVALLALLAVPMLAFPAAAEADLSEGQAARIEEMIHRYIMENPEVILDSVRAYSEKQEAESQLRVRERLVALRDQLHEGPSVGAEDADVVLVEFFDYRCGYCKKALPTVVEMLEEDPNLRVVFKEYPILSPESRQAARAALAARNQGMYFELHNALMESRSSYSDSQIMDIAAEVGLDTDRLARDMASPEVEEALAATAALARELGITGTPTFVVRDVLVPGAIDAEAMRKLIADARAAG